MSRELDQFGDLTRARRSRVDAVRRRIDQAVPTGSAVAGALVRIPTPGEDAVARVKAAVIAKNPRPVSGPAWGPMLGAALALLLVAGGGVPVGRGSEDRGLVGDAAQKQILSG